MIDHVPISHAYPRYLFEPSATREFYEARADQFLLTLDDLGLSIDDRRAAE